MFWRKSSVCHPKININMKNYVDWYYGSILPKNNYVMFDKTDIDNIPDNVDLIAVSQLHSNLIEHQKLIDQLLPKTNKLIYLIGEAVNHDLVDFLLKNNSPKIEFLIDAVLNVPISNVKTISSWFISPHNFYVTAPPVASLLNEIQNDISKPKYFDCLLGTKRDHRDQITRFYKNSDHRDKFIFSYYKNHKSVQGGIWDIDLPDDVEHSANMISFHGYKIPLSAILPVKIYNESYYSIVAETTCHNDYNQYTEKVAKPILAQRLFVAFAGQHYLRNLRNKGFLTFNSVIDESYDSIEDPDIRFYQAWKQVEYLCSQDPDKIMKMIKPVVEYNKNLFLRTNWHKELKLTLSYHSGARLP
jgi:hypothetical protein